MANDLDRIRQGDSTLYNSTLDILQRINKLQEQAIMASYMHTPEGVLLWRNILEAMVREVYPYCSPEELEELQLNAVSESPIANALRNGRPSKPLIINYRKKLDRWEKVIRKIIAAHGMALKAGRDTSLAILGGG